MRKAAYVITPDGEKRELTPDQFQALYEERGEIVRDYAIFEMQTGLPLTFRKKHSRKGNEEQVSPTFVHDPGSNVVEDRVFDRKTRKKLSQALQEGKKVLLSLNVDLTHKPVDFRNASQRDPRIVASLENWQKENHGQYITFPVETVAQVVETLQRIKNLVPGYSVDRNVYALHRGGVMPMRVFNTADKSLYLSKIFHDVSRGTAAVPYGKDRMIGFPRLMRFIPTKTTLDNEATGSIRGNFLDAAHGSAAYIGDLVFSDRTARSTPEFEKMRHSILKKGKQGVLVLASPTTDKPSSQQSLPFNKWAQTRWIINDPAVQVTAIEPI